MAEFISGLIALSIIALLIFIALYGVGFALGLGLCAGGLCA